jgi:predicted Fe-Mo cluster-binding NifX family protein
MVVVAATLAVAILSVGCAAGSSALTRAEFVEKADAICQKAKDQALESLKEKGIDLAHAPSASEAREVEDVISSVIASRDSEIIELGLPEEEPERRQVEGIVRAFEEAAADHGLAAVEPKVEALNEKARAFGFHVCGGQ